jgi:hypothetical protein
MPFRSSPHVLPDMPRRHEPRHAIVSVALGLAACVLPVGAFVLAVTLFKPFPPAHLAPASSPTHDLASTLRQNRQAHFAGPRLAQLLPLTQP